MRRAKANLVLIVCLVFGSSLTYAQQSPTIINGPPIVFGHPQLRRITRGEKPFIELKASSKRIGEHQSSHGALFYGLKIGDVAVRDIGSSGVYSSTLIFIIGLEEFSRMKNGDPILILYGDDVVDSFCCLRKQSVKRNKAYSKRHRI